MKSFSVLRVFLAMRLIKWSSKLIFQIFPALLWQLIFLKPAQLEVYFRKGMAGLFFGVCLGLYAQLFHTDLLLFLHKNVMSSEFKLSKLQEYLRVFLNFHRDW